MKTTTVWMALLALAAIVPATSFGHARLRLDGNVPPRNNSTGLKSGPCGGIARTNTPKVLTAGQQLTIQWEQVINHPGYYRIAFSPSGDTGFDDNVLVPMFQNTIGQQFFETTITVPSTPCTNCTIQLIQYMTENDPPSLYYSCGDIEIRAAGSNPVPTSTPNCAK
ncbi:MAG: lytic polysaccharide monooxygenase [Bdellovibrionales bacterium]|nr:lytic polysaccharide monooxygenase [Bdellovibrionales bacterium]